MSSKKLVPNSVLKTAIHEYAEITREKARIEEAKRQLLEHQHFVLRRENALHQVMQSQRTLQIAQARQEAETCALLLLDQKQVGAAVGREDASAQTEHERMLAAEGRRRAEEEKEKERHREEQKMQELLAADEEERKREYERQERELKLQVGVMLY